MKKVYSHRVGRAFAPLDYLIMFQFGVKPACNQAHAHVLTWPKSKALPKPFGSFKPDSLRSRCPLLPCDCFTSRTGRRIGYFNFLLKITIVCIISTIFLPPLTVFFTIRASLHNLKTTSPINARAILVHFVLKSSLTLCLNLN